jgi:gliding motility-associated-like protein
MGTPDTFEIHVLYLEPQDVEVHVTSPICEGTSTVVWVTTTANSEDTLTYIWNEGLGPGPGAFVVVPDSETVYIVTVTNSCGFSVSDSAALLFAPPPTVDFIADAAGGCEPLTVQFYDSSHTNFDEIETWTWNFGDGTGSSQQNPQHTYNHAGTYEVTLSVVTGGGCTATSAGSPFYIYIYENPEASFWVSSTELHLPYDAVSCFNTSLGAVTYHWDFGDGTTSAQENPVHTYQDLGEYEITLLAIGPYGCSDTASLSVTATSDIIFPNVFTPDPDFASGGEYDAEDLSNHVFFPYATGVEEFHILIFNRWGELLFESDDIHIGWDGYYRGKLCQQDVYVYKATATFIDGRKVEKIGDVTLLR